MTNRRIVLRDGSTPDPRVRSRRQQAQAEILVEQEDLEHGDRAQQPVVDEVLIHEPEDPDQRDSSPLRRPRYSLLDLDRTIDISDDDLVNSQGPNADPVGIPSSPSPTGDTGIEAAGGNETIQVLDSSMEELRGRTSRTGEAIIVDVDQSSPPSRINLNDESVIVLSDSPPVSLRNEESESANPDAGDLGGPSCPICLLTFKSNKQSGTELLSTVCGHIFCGGCLREWLLQSQQCPVCRARITKKNYHPIFF